MYSQSTVMQQVGDGKHVIIDWKMSLLYKMKDHFLKTGQCDFVLGMSYYEPKVRMFVNFKSYYFTF